MFQTCMSANSTTHSLFSARPSARRISNTPMAPTTASVMFTAQVSSFHISAASSSRPTATEISLFFMDYLTQRIWRVRPAIKFQIPPNRRFLRAYSASASSSFFGVKSGHSVSM